MAEYLLIQSRDPFVRADVAADLTLARDLDRAGDDVSLFLVQNGVLPLRPGSAAASLDTVLGTGVRVLADEFSLRERGMDATDLKPGVEVSSLDTVVDRLAEGHKTIWL